MLKSIQLTNFQSHRDSYLVLHEGVNIIVGQSDSGKSAILRALRWAITNKPSGDSFRSSWGGKTGVEVFTDDAHIVRSRDKENEYVLGDMHFKAFSTDVPKEISDAFNISDTNLQAQLDQPYLLSETSGDVASHWNKIAHLESIDKGTANVNSAIRELTSEIKYKSEQEVKFIEDLKAYENLDKFEADVEVLESIEKEKSVLANSVNKLHAVTSAYKLTDVNLKEKSEILKFEKPLNNILDLIDQKKHAEASFYKLYQLEADILRCEEGIKHVNQTLTLEQPVSNLLELYKNRQIAVEGKMKLSKTLLSISDIQTRITNGNAFIEAKKQEFDKEMPDICPLCGENRIKPNMTR